ncbi:tetratricopeptide repeat protein [Hafnia alvei]|uniref:Tetratrico peptide repeat-containing protein n=1 Tax=Hafnia alvei TaxID=569 RepID=A0A1C6Z6I6_HAFAL|nr:tetratricopeptide repeat protein [Hafnia alvei]NLS55799.1 tetratricopeptide repeat protein [Hafnia alvei]SCM54802.1 Tetratrico peptide repeat-containing protein [Hafnia alvei]
MILSALKNKNYASALDAAIAQLVIEPDSALMHYYAAWACDGLGQENRAIPYYEKAIALGLPEADLKEAYLGLGSTYRVTGHYQQSLDLLTRATAEFPDDKALQVFYALAKYSVGDAKSALRDTLLLLTSTTQDDSILAFRKAIDFYAQDLDFISD